MIERAEERRRAADEPTIFFLDEIHRFNKAQQDALLPAVEEGLVTLIGATTENPYFEVNSALLSRAQIYELRAARAAPHVEQPAATGRSPTPSAGSPSRPTVDRRGARAARHALGRRRAGRARRRSSARPRPRGPAAMPVDLAAAEDALQRKALSYDREGDRHYDYISAWIKATRGSDPDASLYYLAVMLEGGEDPRFIARRMVILASEDVGNADPQALVVANAAAAGGRPGRPARVPPQPRPGRRLPGAGAEVERLLPRHPARHGPRPRARREAAARLPARRPLPGRRKLGRGIGYVYPHDEPGGVADQPLLPGGPRGRALLRAHRPRLRGGAATPARGDSTPARRAGRSSG